MATPAPGMPDVFSKTKITIWVNLGCSCNGRVWYVLWPLGNFSGHLYILWHLGTFYDILNILLHFGIFYRIFVYFMAILVYYMAF
jgi:hypothetical protein